MDCWFDGLAYQIPVYADDIIQNALSLLEMLELDSDRIFQSGFAAGTGSDVDGSGNDARIDDENVTVEGTDVRQLLVGVRQQLDATS